MVSIVNEIKLVIFDLDDTLMSRNEINLIDVKSKDIIKYFKDKGCKIVLCSLNKMASWFLFNNNILDLFDFVISQKFDDECENQKEIDQCKSTNKGYMYKAIVSKFGISRKNILIFDDSLWHKIEALKYKIRFVLVTPKKLITWNDVKTGERMFRYPEIFRRSNSF